LPKSAETFMEGLNQPFGLMARGGDTFYVGNTDGVGGLPFLRGGLAGANSLNRGRKKLVSFKPSDTGA